MRKSSDDIGQRVNHLPSKLCFRAGSFLPQSGVYFSSIFLPQNVFVAAYYNLCQYDLNGLLRSWTPMDTKWHPCKLQSSKFIGTFYEKMAEPPAHINGDGLAQYIAFVE